MISSFATYDNIFVEQSRSLLKSRAIQDGNMKLFLKDIIDYPATSSDLKNRSCVYSFKRGAVRVSLERNQRGSWVVYFSLKYQQNRKVIQRVMNSIEPHGGWTYKGRTKFGIDFGHPKDYTIMDLQFPRDDSNIMIWTYEDVIDHSIDIVDQINNIFGVYH